MDNSSQFNMAIGKTDPAENARAGSRTDFRTPRDWDHYSQGALLLILVGAVYFHVLTNLFRQWFADPNYSHGIFVPLFSALWCWNRRQTWTQLPARP